MKLRVEGLHNKNARENSRADTRDRRVKNANRRRDGEDAIIPRINIDPPIFNSILDPKIFSDWVADLDYYFDWYRFIEESTQSRARFARMRLSGSVRIYWTSIERVH